MEAIAASALLEAIRQTKNTIQKKAYMLDIPSLINELGTELREGTYQPSRFSCFVVKEPKIREIFAPHYRDRVVHHILVDRVEPFIDKRSNPLSADCIFSIIFWILNDFPSRIRRKH